jgi:hypothetical protein
MNAKFAWIAENAWLYPALEVVHIVGIALLLGNLLLLELRVWGWGPELPILPLARLSLRLSITGFLLAAASGLFMFASQPEELLANSMFTFKMFVLMVAGLNAALFHTRGGLERLDAVARGQTVVSLGLWLVVIVCGRWIAYQ